MIRVVVVGEGRIGRALQHTWGLKAHEHLGGRALLAAPNLEHALGEAEVVVHAAGPAGDAVCCLDPAGAFAQHYTLTEQLAAWATVRTSRRLVVLGTVAPDTGFYGPLKRAAIRAARREMRAQGDVTQLTVVEAGHVIGEGMSVHESPGVAARFIQEAVTRGTLTVPTSAALSVRFTPLSSLIETLDRVVHVPTPTAPVLSPVTAAVPVRELARMVVRLVSILYDVEPEVRETPAAPGATSYTDPTGEVVPVKPLAETLMAWLRTLEVKMLFRPRRPK